MDRISIRLSGKDDSLLLEDFLQQLGTVQHALRECERVVSGSDDEAMEIRVVGMEFDASSKEGERGIGGQEEKTM